MLTLENLWPKSCALYQHLSFLPAQGSVTHGAGRGAPTRDIPATPSHTSSSNGTASQISPPFSSTLCQVMTFQPHCLHQEGPDVIVNPKNHSEIPSTLLEISFGLCSTSGLVISKHHRDSCHGHLG